MSSSTPECCSEGQTRWLLHKPSLSPVPGTLKGSIILFIIIRAPTGRVCPVPRGNLASGAKWVPVVVVWSPCPFRASRWLFYFFFFSFSFKQVATPAAYGRSRARGQTIAMPCSYVVSHKGSPLCVYKDKEMKRLECEKLVLCLASYLSSCLTGRFSCSYKRLPLTSILHVSLSSACEC